MGWKAIATAIGVPDSTLRRHFAAAEISLHADGEGRVSLSVSVCSFLRAHFRRLFR